MNKPVVKQGKRGLTVSLTKELKKIGLEHRSEVDVRLDGNKIIIENKELILK